MADKHDLLSARRHVVCGVGARVRWSLWVPATYLPVKHINKILSWLTVLRQYICCAYRWWCKLASKSPLCLAAPPGDSSCDTLQVSAWAPHTHMLTVHTHKRITSVTLENFSPTQSNYLSCLQVIVWAAVVESLCCGDNLEDAKSTPRLIDISYPLDIIHYPHIWNHCERTLMLWD